MELMTAAPTAPSPCAEEINPCVSVCLSLADIRSLTVDAVQLSAVKAASHMLRRFSAFPDIDIDELSAHAVAALVRERGRYRIDGGQAWTSWAFGLACSRIKDLHKSRRRRGFVGHISEALCGEDIPQTHTPADLCDLIPARRPGEFLDRYLLRVADHAATLVQPGKRVRRGGGRPPLPLATRLQALALHDQGQSYRAIAERLDIGAMTVAGWAKSVRKLTRKQQTRFNKGMGHGEEDDGEVHRG